MKSLFRGVFNYSREVEILYRYASTERQAWLVMCKALAKKHDVNLSYVMGLFDGHSKNYEITIEVEVRECDSQTNNGK